MAASSQSGKANGAPLRIGAVAYDPKVVAIWEGFKEYFAKKDLPIDYLLFSNYDAQVAANLAGEIDVAWNSPLAWIKSQIDSGGACDPLAMRDTDRDLLSRILVSKHSGIEALRDLNGKTIAVGAHDSPQATLIPLFMLFQAGIDLSQCKVLYHDVMLGKHGDHVGGERDAARALAAGAADAACVLDANHLAFVNEGTLDPGSTRVLASTAPFDHCNFTARNGLPAAISHKFAEALMSMSYDDPEVHLFMEMEGLKRWLPARTSGYAQLEGAVKWAHFYD